MKPFLAFRRFTLFFARFALSAFVLSIWPIASPVLAQDVTGCLREDISQAPARQVFTCGDALIFEREPSAALRIMTRPNDPAPRSIEIEGGAILLDVAPGATPTRIRTPHAIATVRGTTYVVDAGADSTSVFVVEGAVQVRRVDDASVVTLRAGEGVDVTPGEALSVRTWGAGRVAALLARFGR